MFGIDNPVEPLIRASNNTSGTTLKPRERTLSPEEIGCVSCRMYLGAELARFPTIKLAVKIYINNGSKIRLHATWMKAFEKCNILHP